MEKKSVIAMLSALAHDTRLDVFKLLVTAGSDRPGEGGLVPGELAERLALPAPTLSFHLKELMQAGLIEGERRGRSILYRPVFTAIADVANYLLEDCCQGAAGGADANGNKEIQHETPAH